MTTTPIRCKQVLERYYGAQFQGLVLYGSYARNQETNESDLDLLVLLSQPFDSFQELRRIEAAKYVISG